VRAYLFFLLRTAYYAKFHLLPNSVISPYCVS
jgi:hypothetical protein